MEQKQRKAVFILHQECHTGRLIGVDKNLPADESLVKKMGASY